MVKCCEPGLDATFQALADPTRRAILARLARGEFTVTDLARPFRMSLPAVWKHLRVLEGAGLLAGEKDGRVRRCRLSPAPLRSAAEWIAFYRGFWEAQFDSLARFLETHNKEEPWQQKQQRARKRWSRSGARSRRRGRKSSRRGPTPR